MATIVSDAQGSDPIEQWLANGAGTEKMRLTAAGNLGIGTTSPGFPFDARASNGWAIIGGDGTQQIGIFNSTANSQPGIGTRSNHKLFFSKRSGRIDG